MLNFSSRGSLLFFSPLSSLPSHLSLFLSPVLVPSPQVDLLQQAQVYEHHIHLHVRRRGRRSQSDFGHEFLVGLDRASFAPSPPCVASPAVHLSRRLFAVVPLAVCIPLVFAMSLILFFFPSPNLGRCSTCTIAKEELIPISNGGQLRASTPSTSGRGQRSACQHSLRRLTTDPLHCVRIAQLTVSSPSFRLFTCIASASTTIPQQQRSADSTSQHDN
jgi:hypothetical protein